jgi:hypothetical protein
MPVVNKTLRLAERLRRAGTYGTHWTPFLGTSSTLPLYGEFLEMPCDPSICPREGPAGEPHRRGRGFERTYSNQAIRAIKSVSARVTLQIPFATWTRWCNLVVSGLSFQ